MPESKAKYLNRQLAYDLRSGLSKPDEPILGSTSIEELQKTFLTDELTVDQHKQIIRVMNLLRRRGFENMNDLRLSIEDHGNRFHEYVDGLGPASANFIKGLVD